MHVDVRDWPTFSSHRRIVFLLTLTLLIRNIHSTHPDIIGRETWRHYCKLISFTFGWPFMKTVLWFKCWPERYRHLLTVMLVQFVFVIGSLKSLPLRVLLCSLFGSWRHSPTKRTLPLKIIIIGFCRIGIKLSKDSMCLWIWGVHSVPVLTEILECKSMQVFQQLHSKSSPTELSRSYPPSCRAERVMSKQIQPLHDSSMAIHLDMCSHKEGGGGDYFLL